jgi:hypothetical protein
MPGLRHVSNAAPLLCALMLACASVRPALANTSAPDSIPRLPEPDRIRLAEAFRLADAVQDRVWPQWSTAPFVVLLVTPGAEFLVRHPAPTPDFSPLPYDSLLGSRVYWRKRVFPATMQATFPAVAGLSTVVIGTPESGRQKSTRWVLTLMHEHFHQWQETRPGYMDAVKGLDLARGDSTGMWMLNFPFPYSDSTVAPAFDRLCRLELQALGARGSAGFVPAYRAYDDARRDLAQRLRPDDARYLAFQLWKEGVARYTEYRVAIEAAGYAPSPAYRALPDYTPFGVEADSVLIQIEGELARLHLASWQRIAVYPTGAGEALLLDALEPGWKRDYTRKRFTLDSLFPPVRR